MDYPEREGLKIVLDFVERHNKFDKEKDVAAAAADLETFLQAEITKAHSY